MAKLEMKKIELLAPIEQSKDIIDCLQLLGTVELTNHEESGSLYKLSTDVTVSTFERFLNSCLNAQKVLSQYAPVKKGLLSSFEGRHELTFSEYLKKSDDADIILNKCFQINGFETQINEATADIVRCRSLMDALEPWLGLDIPMQYKGTESTAVFIGSFPCEYSLLDMHPCMLHTVYTPVN